MTNFKHRLATRLRYAAVRFNQLNGELVSYRRVTGDLVTDVLASPIRLPMDEILGDIAVKQADHQEWAIDLAQLIFNLAQFLPKENDVIIRENGDWFELTSFGFDNSPYRFVTNTRDRVIVHGIRIKKGT